MLFSVTIKSFVQNTLDFALPVTTCLINTDNILDVKADASDALVQYIMNPYSDHFSPFWFITDQTPANIVTGSNVTSQSNIINLPVFEEGDVTDSHVHHYYNVADIVWAIPYATNYSEVFVLQKGWKVKKILVDLTVADVLGLADTGTTA
jgi:hypothetical protein